MKDYWEEPKQKKVNKKKIISVAITSIVVIVTISIAIVYYNNKPVREWIDKNILRKEKL